MRKGVKKQVLGLLATVSEALHYVKTTKNKDECPMLENCLLCMESIIKTIGCSKDENDIVSNSAKRFGQDLLCAQHSVDCPREFKKALFSARRELAFIRCEVEKIKPRLEFVFLPYKASMWDSFESIWRSAQADSSCDAYVVPVPYYDLNPDRTVSRLNYEGGLFPADVPIVDYRKYNFEERRPDVVFIHNPYDGYNRVTSIAAEFHSDKLKMYTEMLVYVPYDVVTDLVSEHMCRMPGVINADLIVVQSRRAKEVYTKYVPDEKVLALGSPKIDKVVWMQEHMPTMPESWDKIARGRKLILYNTHLSPLMVDDGTVCNKLRSVFSFFKGRNDVCLLWRPHPLSQATMESMNPQPLKEYLHLVEEYKQSEIGIYDDTADVHRAICLASAYYGDAYSSLMPMFGVTGKPIMVHDMHNQIDETASFNTYIVDGNTMWFTSYYFNGLFRMDMTTKRVSFVGKFPGEQDCFWMYSKILKNRNCLYFFPAKAQSIAQYDLDTSTIKMHSLEHPSHLFSEGRSFFTAVVWGEWVYILPWVSHVVVKMHMNSGEIVYERDWYEQLRPFVRDEQQVLFSNAVQRGKYVWCAFWQGNLVVRFDLEKMSIKIFPVGTKDNTYFNITEHDGDFWLVAQYGNTIARWNPQTQAVREYKHSSDKEKFGLNWRVVLHKGIAWILPLLGDKILKLDIETGEFSEWTQYPDGFAYVKKFGVIKYDAFEVESGVITLFPAKSNMLLRIDMGTGKSVGMEIKWPEYSGQYFSKYLKTESADSKNAEWTPVYQENQKFSSLEDFLKMVDEEDQCVKKQREAYFCRNFESSDGKCGERVYKKINEIIAHR